MLGNRLTDIGDLPVRAKLLRDLRFDMNPARSPPGAVLRAGTDRLKAYTRTRVRHIKELFAGIEAMGLQIVESHMTPTVKNFFAGDMRYLSQKDCNEVYYNIDRLVNGDLDHAPMTVDQCLEDIKVGYVGYSQRKHHPIPPFTLRSARS